MHRTRADICATRRQPILVAHALSKELDMILGMSLSAFTLFHVAISLVAIAAGLVAFGYVYGTKLNRGWTALFLATTAFTCVTGYFFPAEKVLPSHIVGGLTLIVLAIAVLALYRYRLSRSWRWIYVVSAATALYLNVFVGVVQAFLKVSFLHSLAPTQAEAPFVIAQVVVLLAFAAAAVIALRVFRPNSTPGLAAS
jgi:hypothetical protein